MKFCLLRPFFLCLLVISSFAGYSQNLQPGFQPKEYLQLLSAVERFRDSTNYQYSTPAPEGMELKFRSEPVPLENSWQFWLRNDNVGIISIRGTTSKGISWLENFYCAMIPAIGSLQINDSTKFEYRLAADTNALVHAGWTLGLAFIAPGVLETIKSNYQQGVKEFIIFGHSQGGALAFLLTSYLYYLKGTAIPSDIVLKSYCSAAPKPGNLYYAYDFDFITRDGWGLHVVNALDWVPESPMSIQTLSDMNKTSPLNHIDRIFSRQKLFEKIYLKHAFGSMEESTKKASKKFQKYLGNDVFKLIHKTLPQLKEPEYGPSMNYMSAGTPIILQPYPGYREQFADSTGRNFFLHHHIKAYYELTRHHYDVK